MKAIELLKMYQYADDHLQGLMSKELNEAIQELEDLQEYLDETKDCGWCKEHRAIIQWDKTDQRKNR